MSKYLLLIISLFSTVQLFSQSQSAKEKLIIHNKLSKLISEAINLKYTSDRSFKMKFDTLYLLLADHPNAGELVTTVVVEYDGKGRISSAKINNESDEDYNYYYKYKGDESRFSTMDYFLLENGIERYDGFQSHLYNIKGTLISSKEFTKDNELVYADSLNITFDSNERVTSQTYLFYQGGAWNKGSRIYNVQYNGDAVIKYSKEEEEYTQQGNDTIIDYLYDDLVFLNNDQSFLFKGIQEFFEIDSAGVDNFFLSREDAAQFYVNRPIQYKKYLLDGVTQPPLLFEKCVFEKTDLIRTIVQTSFSTEIYQIHYGLNDDNKLDRYYFKILGDTSEFAFFKYNEHGRISEITYESDQMHSQEFDNYVKDDQDRLVEFRQDIIFDFLSGYSTILKFGYRGPASIIGEDVQTTLLYPNPADKQLILEIPSQINSLINYTIIDCHGKNLLSGKVLSGDEQITLSVGDLIPGTYQVVLNSKDKKWISRFVKI